MTTDFTDFTEKTGWLKPFHAFTRAIRGNSNSQVFKISIISEISGST